MDEVFAEHLPDPGPDKANAGHVKVCDFNESLQTELAGIHSVVQLLPRHFAQVLNEQNDRILVKVEAALEDLIDLCHGDVLHD